MSRTIDEKVLSMQFDNKQFESAAAQTMSTLDKFNKKCDNVGNTNGFSSLEQAINNINNHFTLMGRVSERVLDTIVNKIESVVTSATRMAKSLTFDQVGAGFSKYESITKSTATILGAMSESDRAIAASLGLSDLDYVNSALEKMNQYTDETSYNLTDMTDNVGKFMAAGVDLETAVSAMEGIGNWAARSGAGINEASRAMYNLSQAMGVGAVTTIDWKSIENANMATKEFKEQVIATAKELGTLNENSDVTSENFRDSLSDKWFTSDVLIKTLDDYNAFYNQLLKIQETAEADGMTITDIIGELQDGSDLGNKWMEEYAIDLDSLAAKSFLAAQEYKTFGDVIDATSDAISTSWMNIFKDIFGDLDESKDLWGRVGDDFYDTFAQPIANLQNVMDQWKDLGGRNILLAAFDDLREAVDSIIGPIKTAFGEVFGFWAEDGDSAKAAQGLLNWTAALRKFTKSLIATEGTSEGIRKTFVTLFSVIKALAGGFIDLVGVGIQVAKFFIDIGAGLIDFINGLTEARVSLDGFAKAGDSFEEIFNKLWKALGRFVDRLKDIPVLGTAVTWLTSALTKLWDITKKWGQQGVDWLNETFNLDIQIKSFGDALQFLLTPLILLGKAIINLVNTVRPFFENLDYSTPLEFIKSLGSAIGSLLNTMKDNGLKKLNEFMAKDGPFQSFINSIKNSGLADILKSAGQWLGNFFTSLFNNFTGINWKLIAEVGLIGALTLVAKKIADFIKSVTGVGRDLKDTLLNAISGPTASFTKAMNAAANDMNADAMIKVATAIGILTVSIMALSAIDADALGRCTVVVLALLWGLSKAINGFANLNNSKSNSLANTLSNLGTALQSLFKSVAIGTLIVSLSMSLIAIAFAIKQFADIDESSLKKAGVAIAAISALAVVMSVALNNMKNIKAKTLLGASAMLIALPVSLKLVGTALKSLLEAMDGVTTDQLKQVGIVIGVFATIATVMLGILGSIGSLGTTNRSPFKGITTALIGLIAALALAGKLQISAKKMKDALDVVQSCIILFLQIAGITVGAGLLFKIFPSLAEGIDRFTTAALKISGIITSIALLATGLAALTAVSDKIPAALVNIAKTIRDNAETIADAAVKVLSAIVLGMAAYKGKMIAQALLLVTTVIKALGDKLPDIVEELSKIIGDILDAVAVIIEKAAEYIVPSIVTIINTVASAIDNNRGPILNAISNLWNAAVGLISEAISKFTGLDYDSVFGFVNFSAKAGVIVAAINKITKALTGMTTVTTDSKTGVSTFTSGIGSMVKSMTSTPAAISSNIGAVKNFGSAIQNALVNTGSFIQTLSANVKGGSSGLVGALSQAGIAFGGLVANIGIFLPYIAAAAAGISGLLILDKQEQEAIKKHKEELYGLSEAEQASIDATNDYIEAWNQVSEVNNNTLKTNAEYYDNLESLGEQYDGLKDKSSSAANGIIDTICAALGLNQDQVQDLINKYGTLSNAMQMYLAQEEANSFMSDLKTSIDADQEELNNSLDERTKAFETYYKNKNELDTAQRNKEKYDNGVYLNQTKQQYIESYMSMHNVSRETAELAWKGIGDMLQEQLDSGEQAYKESYEALSKWTSKSKQLELEKQTYNEMLELAQEYSQAVADGDTEKTEKIVQNMNDVMSAYTQNIDSMTTTSSVKAEDLLNNVSTLKEDLKMRLKMDNFDDTLVSDEELESTKQKLTEAYRGLGLSAVSELDEAIREANESGDSALATMLEEIKTEITNGSEDTDGTVKVGGKNLSSKYMEGLAEGMKSGDLDAEGVIESLGIQLGEVDLASKLPEGSLDIFDALVKNAKSSDMDTSELVTLLQEKLSPVLEQAFSTDGEGGFGTSANASNLIKPALANIEIDADTISTVKGKVKTATEEAVNTGAKEADVSNAGSEAMANFGTAITDNSSKAETAAKTVSDNAAAKLDDGDTETSGKNFLAGFSRGLSSMSGAIGSKCYSLAQNFIKQFNTGLNERSPSKETEKSGRYFLEGFAIGVDKLTDSTATKVRSVAEQFVDNFKSSIDLINESVLDNIDMTPTITPVLDLSEIQNGSEALNSMLGISQYAFASASGINSNIVSPAERQTEAINQAMSSKMEEVIAAQREAALQDQTYTFNIPLEMNGRQLARATRTYNQQELNNLQTIQNRKAGIK